MARQKEKDGSVTHERETYSWGTLRKVGNVKGSMIVHPRDHDLLSKVPPGGEHTFQDETRTRWNVKRSEDGKEFHATGKRPGFAGSTKITGTWSKLAGEESGPTNAKVSHLKAFSKLPKRAAPEPHYKMKQFDPVGSPGEYEVHTPQGKKRMSFDPEHRYWHREMDAGEKLESSNPWQTMVGYNKEEALAKMKERYGTDPKHDRKIANLKAFRDQAKAERNLETGKRGGQYYTTASGQKIYIGKKVRVK